MEGREPQHMCPSDVAGFIPFLRMRCAQATAIERRPSRAAPAPSHSALAAFSCFLWDKLVVKQTEAGSAKRTALRLCPCHERPRVLLPWLGGVGGGALPLPLAFLLLSLFGCYLLIIWQCRAHTPRTTKSTPAPARLCHPPAVGTAASFHTCRMRIHTGDNQMQNPRVAISSDPRTRRGP